MMGNGLRGLGDLYELIGELVRLLSNQQSLHPKQRKWVEEQLNDYLRILDLTGAVRNSLVAMREHVQDLQSTIRRKGNAPTVSEKKAQKLIKDCLRALRRMDGKPLPFSFAIKDSDMLVKVLMEARESTISLSVLSFLSKPKQKASRWSMAMSKRRVTCEGEWEGATEEEGAYMWLLASHDCLTCKDVDAKRVLKARYLLQSLEVKMDSTESGLDFKFKRHPK